MLLHGHWHPALQHATLPANGECPPATARVVSHLPELYSLLLQPAFYMRLCLSREPEPYVRFQCPHSPYHSEPVRTDAVDDRWSRIAFLSALQALPTQMPGPEAVHSAFQAWLHYVQQLHVIQIAHPSLVQAPHLSQQCDQPSPARFHAALVLTDQFPVPALSSRSLHWRGRGEDFLFHRSSHHRSLLVGRSRS